MQWGGVVVNDSFEETRKRKYKSELRIRPQGKLRLLGKIKLYNGASIFVSNNAMLTIGDNTFINTNSNVICFNEIKIGNNCAISDNVYITDSDSHQLNENTRSAPTVIEDNVWIGYGCTILKGVTIGKGSVIGANSVVTKSIPPYCLAVGTPAKVIKKDITWQL